MTVLILLVGRTKALPYIILKYIGARLSKRLILQQIYNIIPESRIYLLGEYFINKADLLVAIKMFEIFSSIFNFSTLVGAILVLSIQFPPLPPYLGYNLGWILQHVSFLWPVLLYLSYFSADFLQPLVKIRAFSSISYRRCNLFIKLINQSS